MSTSKNTTSKKYCSVIGCVRDYYQAGFCNMHYLRKRRNQPMDNFPIRGYGTLRLIHEAVQSNTNDCIIWKGSIRKDGYGRLTIKGKEFNAHRLSLSIYSGITETHLLALHGPCNNKACINPRHLYWGTPKQNMDDRRRDGTAPLGEKSTSALITSNEVIEIRKRREKGETLAKIAKDYPITKDAIYSIVKGRTWKHLD